MTPRAEGLVSMGAQVSVTIRHGQIPGPLGVPPAQDGTAPLQLLSLGAAC